MHVDNQDIIRMARELRDEENKQLHVSRWRVGSRSVSPAWLAAIPAAAIVGFLFGIWTNSQRRDDLPLQAMTDTVYIKVKENVERVDTVYLPRPAHSAAGTNASKAVMAKTSNRQPAYPTGQSAANDQIRYDLLVKN